MLKEFPNLTPAKRAVIDLFQKMKQNLLEDKQQQQQQQQQQQHHHQNLSPLHQPNPKRAKLNENQPSNNMITNNTTNSGISLSNPQNCQVTTEKTTPTISTPTISTPTTLIPTTLISTTLIPTTSISTTSTPTISTPTTSIPTISTPTSTTISLFQPKNILITGGLGFCGSAVVVHLVRKYEIRQHNF